ncbi:hypothetical protein [Nocardia sp. NBC_00511]|uniref:hypothetical protein n=1 Tax=Nocardia sp. NBC_00511 TaxID=2903591 RepID=UPI0030E14DBC
MIVLIALRLRIVIQRTGHWSGDTCVIGPYNPAERTYLFVITAVFVVTVASALIVAYKTRSRVARWMAVGLIAVSVIVGLHLLAVWGGLESNNRPIPEDPCPTLKERQA